MIVHIPARCAPKHSNTNTISLNTGQNIAYYYFFGSLCSFYCVCIPLKSLACTCLF